VEALRFPGGEVAASRNEILWSRRRLDMDRTSNAKKENFLLKLCNQIA
jgi:hypothetical protein